MVDRATRKKLLVVLFAIVMCAIAGAMLAGTVDDPLPRAISGGAVFGLLLGLVEEFYVQGRRGRWLRQVHPVWAYLWLSIIVMGLQLAAMHINLLVWNRVDLLVPFYARLPFTMPVVFALSLVIVLALRVVGFIGAQNLLYLAIGRYHRPVIEDKVVLFLDLKDSTAIVERLGLLQGQAFLSRVLFDLTRIVTNHGGDVYEFTGDGLVAIWGPQAAFDKDALIACIDEFTRTLEREQATYEARFAAIPRLRIGGHAGPVAISEQGDTRRAIGVYGETVHIAARIEQSAKSVGDDILLSASIAAQLGQAATARLVPRGEISVQGISKPLAIYGLAAAEPIGSRPV